MSTCTINHTLPSNSTWIDIILGADVYEDVALGGKLEESNRLMFRSKVFEWVIADTEIKAFSDTKTIQTSFVSLRANITLQHAMLEEARNPKTSSQHARKERAM